MSKIEEKVSQETLRRKEFKQEFVDLITSDEKINLEEIIKGWSIIRRLTSTFPETESGASVPQKIYRLIECLTEKDNSKISFQFVDSILLHFNHILRNPNDGLLGELSGNSLDNALAFCLQMEKAAIDKQKT